MTSGGTMAIKMYETEKKKNDLLMTNMYTTLVFVVYFYWNLTVFMYDWHV